MDYVANSARLARTFTTGLNASLNPASINSTGSGAFVALTAGNSSLSWTAGTRTLQLEVGDVINSDTASASYTLEYKAVVQNIAGNAAGNPNSTQLRNNGGIRYWNSLSQVQTTLADPVTVTVVEPLLTLTKTANPSAILNLADGQFAYTFKVQNTGNAPAYDVSIDDALNAKLPANTELLSVTTEVKNGSFGTITNTSNTGTKTVAVSVASFPVGGILDVVATVKTTGTLGAISSFDNTATTTWTSLPGTKGTGNATPGNAGDLNGERTGGTGTGSNGYSTNDTAKVVVGSLGLTKELVSTNDRYAIGELVQYELTLSIPAGAAETPFVVNNVVLKDVLQAGLVYAGSFTLTDAGNLLKPSDKPTDFTYDSNTNTLSANFGTVTNSTTSSQTLVVTYKARVANVLGNQNGTVLTNSATLSSTLPGTATTVTTTPATQSITVGEPHLLLTPNVTPVTGLKKGDTVAYSLTVTNNGTTQSCQTRLTDSLPAKLPGTVNSLTVTPGAGAPTIGTANFSFGAGGLTTTTPFSLAKDASFTLSFEVTLSAAVTSGETLSNAIGASFESCASSNVRNGSTPGSNQDDGNLNNYNVNANWQNLTVDSTVAINKTFSPAGKTTYAIGESVVYPIKVDVSRVNTPDMIVNDVLPAGLTYLSCQVSSGDPNVVIANSATIQPEGAASCTPTSTTGSGPTTLTFNLGNVDNQVTGAATTNEYVLVEIVARVDNIVANQSNVTLGNNASVSYLDGTQTKTLNFDADGGVDGIQPLELTVVEPRVTLTQTASPASVSLGDEVTFTLTLTPIADDTGSCQTPAYGLVVTDTLPVGLTYVAASGSPAPTVNGQQLTFSPAAPLACGTPQTISFRARVEPGATVGAPLTNNASLTWISQPGATGAASSGRTGGDGVGGALNDYANAAVAVVVTPTTNAVITADKSVAIAADFNNNGKADVGDKLEYTVLLKNTGADAASNVVFTDPIPANTVYVTNSSTPAGTFDGEVLTVNVGPLASNDEVTIKFQAVIDTGVPAGTLITNQGIVDSAQTVPTPTNRADIRVGGELTAGALYAQKTVAKVAGAAGSTIVNGDTVQYSLTLQNTGATALTNARLTDTLPAGLTYVAASAATAAGIIEVAGDKITWTAGNLAGNASVTATFRATVSGVAENSRRDFINQATVAYTDSANLPRVTSTDSNGTASDGNQPTVFTAVNGTPPPLDVRKRWELTVDKDANGLPSANDTLRYTMTVTNGGATTATDVRLTDAIPANTSVVAGSVTTSQGAVTGSNPVVANLGNLAAGQTATVSFQAVIGSSVTTGTVIQNQAGVSATGLTTSSNTTLTTVINGSQFPTPIAKLVVAHSESVTDTGKALIGEVLTYRLTISIPPGETRTVQFLDTLPSGLRYLDGSARLARSAATLVSSRNPGGINAQSGYGADIEDNEFVDVSATVASDAQTLILALGDVNNTDASGSASYVLQYQALVLNASGNVRGADLSNSGTVSYLNALSVEQTATPMQATVKLQESGLTLGMTAGPSSLLPSGGTTTYTLTVTNSGDAPAYDVRVTDALPVVFTGASTTTSGCTITGLNLTCNIAEIAPGASVTLSFNATAGTIPGNLIINSATATWTSLPGAKGTGDATPGAAGALDGERTGGTGTGSNGYTASASATIVVGLPSLTKTIENPQAHYGIGEIVNYRVTASLPAAFSLGGARIVDTLPVGLSYVAGSASEAVSVSGQTLTFDWGTLNTTTRTLTYQARVDNRLSNQNNTALTNGAQLRYTDPGTGAAAQTAIQSQTALVGEPYLGLTLNVTPTAGLQAGDTVTYSLTLTNSGPATTAAHGVNLNDLLPVGLNGVPGTLRVSGVGGVGAGAFILDAAGLTTATPFTLPVGATLTLSFDARLTSDVKPGESLLNRVVADFASLAGDRTHARTGGDGSNQDDPNTLNNYRIEAQAPALTVGDTVALDKRFHPDPAKNRYAIGEPLTYRLTLNLIEGRTDSVVLIDTLPAGVLYEGAEIGVGSLGMIHQFDDSTHGLTIDTEATGRTRLTFDLGTVINPADGRRDNDYLTIDIQARAANSAATNPDGATLGNQAQVSYLDGTGQSHTRIFDADALTAGIQPLNLIVIEPQLAIEKSVDATEPLWLDDEVTYTLTITHRPTSAADAFDLVVTDRLPDGLTYINGTGLPAPQVAGQTLTFRVPSLTLSQGRTTLSYRARVDETAIAGESLTNRARLGWSSWSGATGAVDSGRTGAGDTNSAGGENDYLDEADATVVIDDQNLVDSQLRLIKTAYLGHDAGAGCPGSKEISVVNKNRVPVNLTWCFSATNTTDDVWLDAPVFTDEGLGIGPGNQSGLRLRSGSFPLAPRATAIWYYEDNRDLSLLNYVELTMTPVDAAGRPIVGADPATGSDSVPAIFGYVFDPPFGVKTGRVGGQDIVRWTMVWVNDNVIRANDVFITDPPPEGMTMYGAPICSPYGSTTVDSCGYEPPSAAFPRGRVIVRANFGPDFGVTVGTIGQAPNRLEIAFDVLVDRPEAEVTYENQGTAEWNPPEVDETFESETYDQTQLDDLDPWLPISEIDPIEIPPGESPFDPRAQADLLLTKTVDNARPRIGQRITFTIKVLNQGPSRATGVQVFDPLPSGYDLITATPNRGYYDPATGYWRIGTLEVSAGVELRVVATVRAEGDYANQADVSGNEFDPQLDDNNDAVVPVPVIPPPSSHSIPTLSEWALILLMVLMLGLGRHYQRARAIRPD